jgi:hypothetical protein
MRPEKSYTKKICPLTYRELQINLKSAPTRVLNVEKTITQQERWLDWLSECSNGSIESVQFVQTNALIAEGKLWDKVT